MIAVFGLPPMAHPNDPSRALLAAMTMQHTLSQMGLRYEWGESSRRRLW